MESSIWLWVGFNAFVLLLLAFDLGVLNRKDHEIKVPEALKLSAFYIALALAFGAGLYYFRGHQDGIDFLTGYLIEKSLSVDNIFVIVLIFTYFSVPKQFQHRVLFWGILAALIMRGVLIFAGVKLIHQFDWMALVFGGFLVVTGVKMLFASDAAPDLENNAIVKAVRRRFRLTDDYRGRSFFVRDNGLLYATPLFLVLVLVEFTDLIFALDSIPAIIAISTDPFIVYTANVFAILGLRALYFALAGIVPRFVYLKYGLSLVLVVIGGKMIANYIHGGKFIPTEIALVVTAVLIGGSIVASLIRTRGMAPVASDTPPTGWVPGSPAKAPAPATAKDPADGR